MVKNFFYRLIQKCLFLVSFVIPWKFPRVIKTHHSAKELVFLLDENEVKRVLFVSDQALVSLNLIQPFIDACESSGIKTYVYDKVVPNPTLDNVEEGFIVAKENNVQWLVAIGGGSVMDAAKAIGVRMVRNRPIKKMRGLLKVLKPIPPLVCIPTTCGTGSETTVASVLSDPATKEKFAISDPSLFPHTAILDPALLDSLPRSILAATGMDALTHALESYLNQNHTKQSRDDALEAMDIIFNHLQKAFEYQDREDKELMLWASFLAGRSFTRAYVGYVHGLAHQLGAHYHIPHGVANAVLLPYVLRQYGESINSKLSFLYQRYFDSSTVLSIPNQADAFISKIENMNQSMSIPQTLNQLQPDDFDIITTKALKEVHPTYPVPRFLTKHDLISLLQHVKGSA